jgi:hypothetical protein
MFLATDGAPINTDEKELIALFLGVHRWSVSPRG